MNLVPIFYIKGKSTSLKNPNNQQIIKNYKEKYFFQNGKLQYVTAIIKNKNGEMLTFYNKKHQSYQIPSGKIDKGENLENGLKREMEEELGINITKCKYISNFQFTVNCMIWQGHFFEVIDYDGDIYNIEKDTHLEFIRTKIIESDNLFGFGIKTLEKEIFDEKEILENRPNIIWYNLVSNKEVENLDFQIDFDNIKINLDKNYIQYFDRKNKSYGFLEEYEFAKKTGFDVFTS